MLGGVDHDFMEPGGGGRLEEVGLAPAGRGPQRVTGRRHALILDLAALFGLRESRVEVGDGADPPARAVRWTPAGAVRPGLGRGAVLAALIEGALLGCVAVVLVGRGSAEVEGAVCTRRSEDSSQAGELVEPDLRRGPPLRHQSAFVIRMCSMSASRKTSPSGSYPQEA